MTGRRAVAVSPHLDDAVFSAGGILAGLAAQGWMVQVVTCFTASVPDPSPFALSTQLDKGLRADVDYMALRRDEDAAACAVLGAEPVHLPLPEAPHRGYDDAAALFAGVRTDDTVARPLAAVLAPLLRGADLVLAPQAIGDHVDHRVVAEVTARLATGPTWWWRDAPYVLRRPAAPPWWAVPPGTQHAIPLGAGLRTKITASRCYTTQTGFQFGGDAQVAPTLQRLARAEGLRSGAAAPVEVFTASAVPRLAGTGVDGRRAGTRPS